MKPKACILLLVVLLNLGACIPEPQKNPCDSTTTGFQETLALKYLINDYTPHCAYSLLGRVTLFFDPAAKYYEIPQNVLILSRIPDTSIFFTLDDTTPRVTSFRFNEPIPIWSSAGHSFHAIGTKSGSQNSLNLRGIYSYQPLQTGQIISYASGDDGNLQIGIKFDSYSPTSTPEYPNDYVSKDKVTGLVWKSCSEGLSGATCTSGALLSPDLNTSKTLCETANTVNAGAGFAGYKNWRLPTMKELLTLNDASKGSLAINSIAFPNSANFAYWSNTPYPTNATFGWYLDLSNGNSYANNGISNYHARCVSSPVLPEATNFKDNADGTVQDLTTGLYWQKCEKGKVYNNDCTGSPVPDLWAVALTYCSSLNLARKSWRLPNRTELVSLMDFKVTGSKPTVNEVFSSGTTAGLYWSSTSYAPVTPSNNAWYVNFDTTNNSLYDFNSKNTSNYIRCVSYP